MIPFGPWLPDLADLEHPGLVRAENLLPSSSGYLPCPSFINDGLPFVAGPVIGALPVRTAVANTDIPYLFIGTPNNVWLTRIDAPNVSVRDVSSLDIPNVIVRDFFLYNGNIYLFSGSSTALRNEKLSGTLSTGTFASSSITPGYLNARVSDFRVFCDINTATLRWSGFDSPEQFAPGTNQSDTQTLNGGLITYISGGMVGLVFCDSTIYRMSYVGISSGVFQFDQITQGVGTIHPKSVVKHDNRIWFLGRAAFYEINDDININEISNNAVRSVIKSFSGADDISGNYDVLSGCVFWLYGSQDSLSNNTHMLVYHPDTKQWSLVLVSLQHLFNFTRQRSDFFTHAMTAAGQMQRMSGPASTAYLETGEFGGDDTSTTMEVRPYIQGNANTVIEVLIGTRNKLTDPVVWTDPVQPDAMGKCNFRVHGRFKRLAFRIYAGFEHAIGYSVTPKFAGKR